MKKLLVLIAFFAFTGFSVKAQRILDRIDRAADRIDRASNTADRAANTADRANSTGGKLLNMFKGKNKAAAAGTETVVIYKNATLTNAKKLRSILQSVKGVSSTEMEYDAASTAISVVYDGSSSDLLDVLQLKASSLVNDNTVKGINKRSITIAAK